MPDPDPKKACIEYAMKEMGWSREEAVRQIHEACKRLGVTYKQYRRYRLARLDPEEQDAVVEQETEREEELRQERDHNYGIIMRETGWSREQAEEELKKAKKRTGCTLKEFQRFRFWKHSEAQQDELYLYRQHKHMAEVWPHRNGEYRLLKNKELTNTRFQKYLARPWCISTEVDLEGFKALFAGSTGVVYKPLFGKQGHGVQAFSFDKSDIETVYRTIAGMERGLVEEFVVQNEVLARFNPNAVNTIRLMSISSNRTPVLANGKMADVATATLKLGGSTSTVVDNLHASGGVCAAVDLETGEILTNGIDWDGNAHTTHPLTGVPIKGVVIPYVREAVQLVYEAIKELKLTGMIGWDVAIGRDGPILIEANASPDSGFVNLPYVEQGLGMRAYMERYLWQEAQS